MSRAEYMRAYRAKKRGQEAEMPVVVEFIEALKERIEAADAPTVLPINRMTQAERDAILRRMNAKPRG